MLLFFGEKERIKVNVDERPIELTDTHIVSY